MTRKLLSILGAVLGLFSAGTFSLFAQSVANPSSLIVPPELASSFGSSGVDPYYFTDLVQFLYGTSYFQGASADQIMITGVSFRTDETTSGGSFDVVIPSITMYLGTYRGPISPPGGLLGVDNGTIVYRHENVRLQSPSGLAFNATFPFDQPFYYDRNAGHLVIGIGSSLSPAGPVRGFDAQPSDEGLYLYRGLLTVSSLPVVVGASFSYVPVPEPKVACLAAFTAACLLTQRRRTRLWRIQIIFSVAVAIAQGPNTLGQSLETVAAGESGALVVPSGLAETFGNTFADPFFVTEPPAVIQVYGAPEFAAAQSDIISITRVAFRLDPAEAGSLSVVVPKISLGMAIFPGTLEDVNGGIFLLPVQTVFEGQDVPLTGIPTVPTQFAVAFQLQTPFTYDRRQGHLVLSFKSYLDHGFIQGVDAQFPGDGVLVRNEPFGRTVVEPRLIVTEFSYVNVPEPSSLAFWGAVSLISGVTCYRLRRET